MILNGESYVKIANYLNSNGYRNKHGREFRPNFNELLRNRKYIGEFVYNRSIARRPDGTRNGHQSKSESEIIRIPGAIPQIVDEGVFYKVQELLDRRKFGKGKKVDRSKYILSSISKCGICGKAVNGNKHVTGRTKYIEITYTCGNKRVARHLKPINMDKMNNYVIRYLKRGILNLRERPKLYRLIVSEYKQSLDNLSKELVVKNKIEKLNTEIDEINKNLDNTPKGMWDIVYMELDKRLVRLEKAKLEESMIEDALENTIEIKRDFVYKTQGELINDINSKNPILIKAVIEKIFKKIEYTNNFITFHINLGTFINRSLNRDFTYEVIFDRNLVVWPQKYKGEIAEDFQIIHKLHAG